MASDLDLTAAWQAEAAYIQWLMFSVLLITLAMSFRHLARAKKQEFPHGTVAALSGYMACVAFSLGVVAALSYFSRMKALQLASPAEGRIHVAISIIGVALLAAECAFTVVMMAT